MSKKIKSFFYHPYFIAFFLGALLATTFAPLYFFPLAFVAFGGWFVLGNNCQNNKQSFLIGWYFGFGQFVFGLYWISISLFVDIARFFWLLPFSIFLIPAVLSVYVGLVLLLVNFIAKKFKIDGWKKILLLAVFWVLFEFLRSILFTGFPWNLLGYSFLFSLPLSQVASAIGVYGLSLIAVIFYSTPALFFKTRNEKIKFIFSKEHKIFASLLSAIIALMWIGGCLRIGSFQEKFIPNATFRLVQPAIKQEEKWGLDYRYNSFLENINLSHKSGLENVNYVVWSESAVPYALRPTSYGLLNDIASASPKNGFVITGGLKAELEEDGQKLSKLWNTIFVINDQSKIVASYDKNHLVPFGEYVPFLEVLPFISKITDGAVNFSEGSGLKTIKLGRNFPSFSPLVCYEAIFPDNIIDKNNPPQFLLNLTNDAWFGSSSGPYQHFDMVRMRSIEYGMPTVRVANSGISAMINPIGKTVIAIPLGTKGVVDVMLMEKLPNTFYLKNGNVAVVLIAILLLLIVFSFALIARQKNFS